MTALGKLFRTTTFKLTLVYLTVFALFAAFLLGYFALNTRRLITEQITDTVNAEITGLSEQYRQGGIRRLVIVVDARARRPGSSLYIVTNFAGEALAGNVTALAPGVLDSPGWAETSYRRLDEAENPEHERPEHLALVRVFQLPGGFRLLVGRDLEERERLYHIVLAAGRWSVAIVIVLGLAGGLFVTRRVLRRVDAMTETTRTIMAGDLGGRLPVAGTGDELDRLADNLNVMLERIEALMHGLKEVSDNIAHDLKTPLTRLRNRSEEALRTAASEAEYRAALEATIEESEGLIRTFNALLMIARAESGAARDDMSEFDAAEIARDIGELYEPLAEEKGIALTVEAEAPAKVKGNRELVSQALANLVDNAIKYTVPRDAAVNGATLEIVVRALNDGDRILLTVADSGPGIPEADRMRAVERFVRLEQSRRNRARGWSEPCLGGGAAAWRRTDACRQRAGTQKRHCLTARRAGTGSGMKRPAKKKTVRGKPVRKPATGATLAKRIVAAPHLVDAKPRKRGSPNGWPACRERKLNRSRRCWPLIRPSARLLQSLAESSPYLWELASGDPGRLLRLLSANPETHLASCWPRPVRRCRNGRRNACDAFAPPYEGRGGAADCARRHRRGVAGDARDPRADRSRRHRGRYRHPFRAGRSRALRALKPKDKTRPQEGSGYIVLAMGKMGAYELNYSSDIDLIVFYDASAPAVPKEAAPAALFVRLTQRMVRLLQERTGDGYVFRADLRLRPDPASTAIAISTAAALSYYESAGQNWERAAHDQGARLRRRHRGRAKRSSTSCRLSCGANISTSPRLPTCTR